MNSSLICSLSVTFDGFVYTVFYDSNNLLLRERTEMFLTIVALTPLAGAPGPLITPALVPSFEVKKIQLLILNAKKSC